MRYCSRGDARDSCDDDVVYMYVCTYYSYFFRYTLGVGVSLKRFHECYLYSRENANILLLDPRRNRQVQRGLPRIILN